MALKNKKPRVGICIYSELKGVFVTIGKTLHQLGYEVWIIARDENVRNLVLRLAPEFEQRIIVIHPESVDKDTIIDRALEIEEKYDTNFSFLMSQDRALGQGYLFNALRHPHIIRSTWPHKKKLKEIIANFLFFENVYKKYKFDYCLGHDRPVALDIILRYNSGIFLTIGIARKADKYIWMETRFEESSQLNRVMKESLCAFEERSSCAVAYEEYAQFRHTAKSLKYTYSNALKAGARIFLHEIYARLKNIHKKNSYVFCGWIPVKFREVHNYHWLALKGVSPRDLTGYKIIFFALHQEPESALLSLSPEFNNSMELIAWISKSIPADYMLVLKENPWGFGVRDRKYYSMLGKLPNVVWARPQFSSLEWIRASKIVATITGTVGFEAVYNKKPVLSFGAHQSINQLPSVIFSRCYQDTKNAIRELVKVDDTTLERSRYALDDSLEKVSFSLPGYEKEYKGESLSMALARIAIKELKKSYGDFADVQVLD